MYIDINGSVQEKLNFDVACEIKIYHFQAKLVFCESC